MKNNLSQEAIMAMREADYDSPPVEGYLNYWARKLDIQYIDREDNYRLKEVIP